MPQNMRVVGVVEMSPDGSVRSFIPVDPQNNTLMLVINHPDFDDRAAIHDFPVFTPTITRHEERLEWKVNGAPLGDGRRGPR